MTVINEKKGELKRWVSTLSPPRQSFSPLREQWRIRENDERNKQSDPRTLTIWLVTRRDSAGRETSEDVVDDLKDEWAVELKMQQRLDLAPDKDGAEDVTIGGTQEAALQLVIKWLVPREGRRRVCTSSRCL